jgi:hypothetical protein
MQSAHQQTASF